MSQGTIFPAFLKLTYEPDAKATSAFLQAVDSTVSTSNRKLSELGRGIDPLSGLTSIMRKQIDDITSSLGKGAGADLGTAAAQQAAAAAGLRAAAARDLAAAVEQAARATGDETREAQSAIAAARALAAQEETAAQAARDHAKALGLVQGQLDKVAAESGLAAGAIGRTAAANDNAHVSVGRFRAGAQQLGYQISDLGTQLSMAANSTNAGKMALTAFSQQIPQAVQAIALMRGEAGGLVGFLAGPWGAGLLAAASIVGTLALAQYDAAKASDAHKGAAEDLVKAIDELHAATVRESRSTQASIQDDLDKANALRTRAQEARKTAVAELQLAQQKASAAGASVSIGAPSYSNTFNTGAQSAAQAQARDLQAQIDGLNRKIGEADETIRLKRGAQIRRGVREELDANASATGRYERAMDRLNSQLQAGKISEAQYRAEVEKVERAHDAASEAAKRSTGAHGRHASAAREDAAAARELTKEIAKLEAAFIAQAQAQAKVTAEAVKAAGEAGFTRMLEQLGSHRDTLAKPALDAARATGEWRAQLQGAIGDLQTIGGFAGTLGGIAAALSGHAEGIGGPGGLLLRQVMNVQWTGVDKSGDKVIYRLGEQLEKAFGARGDLAKVLQSASLGSAAGTLFLGQSGNNAFSAIGGVLGEKAGAGIGKAIGGLGKSLGGPIGNIVGGVLGGLVGSLFMTRPRGSGSVTNQGVTSSANNDGIKASLDSFGLSLQSSIANIADQLGGKVGAYSVGIGRYKDYYQVSGVGNDPYLGQTYYHNKSPNALYDGQDPEAAMRAAIANAIADGAIQGVRAGTQALLKSGSDIQRQLQKALDFENVFKRLKAYTDPIGAAVDGVNSEFGRLKDVFAEAGASAAELADLEKLYGLERAKAVKQANDAVIGSLRDLKDSLTVGNSALSLRDREAAALATYNPLEARVKAGDTTAYDDYQKAARDLLDIERQLSGSQQAYFDLENQILSITNGAIDKQTSLADAATNRDNPFSKSGTGAVNDNASVTSAIDRQTRDLIDGLGFKLDAVNQNLGALIQRAAGRGGIVPDYSKLFANGGSW
jgi:hypothetical protein